MSRRCLIACLGLRPRIQTRREKVGRRVKSLFTDPLRVSGPGRQIQKNIVNICFKCYYVPHARNGSGTGWLVGNREKQFEPLRYFLTGFGIRYARIGIELDFSYKLPRKMSRESVFVFKFGFALTITTWLVSILH